MQVGRNLFWVVAQKGEAQVGQASRLCSMFVEPESFEICVVPEKVVEVDCWLKEGVISA